MRNKTINVSPTCRLNLTSSSRFTHNRIVFTVLSNTVHTILLCVNLEDGNKLCWNVSETLIFLFFFILLNLTKFFSHINCFHFLFLILRIWLFDVDLFKIFTRFKFYKSKGGGISSKYSSIIYKRAVWRTLKYAGDKRGKVVKQTLRSVSRFSTLQNGSASIMRTDL